MHMHMHMLHVHVHVQCVGISYRMVVFLLHVRRRSIIRYFALRSEVYDADLAVGSDQRQPCRVRDRSVDIADTMMSASCCRLRIDTVIVTAVISCFLRAAKTIAPLVVFSSIYPIVVPSLINMSRHPRVVTLCCELSPARPPMARAPVLR